MKLFISILLIVTSSNLKANFITIKHHFHKEEALKIKEIFIEKYNIPFHWIKIEEDKDECVLNKKSKILDMCINKEGELIELSKNEKQINALSILNNRG